MRVFPFLLLVLACIHPSVLGAVCEPLPPPAGNVIFVDPSQVSFLYYAVCNANPGDTILLGDGTYSLNGLYLWVSAADVSIRSASGNREAVILDGNYQTTEIIHIAASNVTVADLTLKRPYFHAIHVEPPTDGDIFDTLIYNVRILDPGQQAIKINQNGTYFADYGKISCCRIELTDTGRSKIWEINGSCYTGGIDAHQSQGWVIQNNVIEGFWCENGLSEHGIHLWRGCRDTLVERNQLIDNARGIGFGLLENGSGRTYDDNPCPGASYVGHYDGIIRNNFVFQTRVELRDSEAGFDCGICLWQACGPRVLHNTVVSAADPFSSIEWRFSNTNAVITNNLISHNFMERDAATAFLEGNLDYQPLSLFIDGPGGDLHLTENASVAVNQGVLIGNDLCVDDIDTDIRGFRPDIGADEIKGCAADLEGDGDVDGFDLADFASEFNIKWNTGHLQFFALEFATADCSE